MPDKSWKDKFKEYVKDFNKESWDWRYRNFINLIDDPVDDVKHWLNGRKILGYTIRIPMRGSGDDTK